MIAASKFGAFYLSGSQAMLAEAVHSVIDTVNSGLLLVGSRQAMRPPDARHPEGYGKSSYFYSTLSASSMFLLGGVFTVMGGFDAILHPQIAAEVPWTTHALSGTVMAFALSVDGWVMRSTLRTIYASKPPGVSLLKHLRTFNDSSLLTILLEDTAALAGVGIASAGIIATHLTGSAVWDGVASIGVGTMLGATSIYLGLMNKRYLLGQSVGGEIETRLQNMVISRPSVIALVRLRTQWLSPFAFALKMEIDFDGAVLAATLLDRFETRILEASVMGDKAQLAAILREFGEELTNAVEDEIADIEAEVRKKYPQAVFIEIEPVRRKS
jgi:zinc transporter 9